MTVATYNIHRGVWPGRPFRSNLASWSSHLQDSQLIGLQEVYGRLFDPLQRRLALTGAFRPAFGRGPFSFGNALLSSWPLTRVRQHQLTTHWLEEPRSALEAVVAIPGGPITAVVTHLGLRRAARRRQVQQLAQRLAALRGPRLLLGDLNGRPGSDEFGPLSEVGLRLLGPTGPTYPKLGLTLDHIYISEGFSVLDVQAMPVAGSDHYPVVARLRLQRR